MKRKPFMLTSILLFLFCGIILNSYAGTLIFKNNKVISKLKIISISKGRIFVEKKDVRKNYSLLSIKAYYDEDIDANSALIGILTPYKANLSRINVPEVGKSTKSKKKKGVELKLSLTLGASKTKTKKIRKPYVYVYLLTESVGEDNITDRQVKVLAYPRAAKVSLKGYDVGKIMKEVLDSGRKTVDANGLSSFSDIVIKLPTSSVGKRKIVAYYIEIYGNYDLIYKTTRKVGLSSSFHLPKKWWESVDYKR